MELVKKIKGPQSDITVYINKNDKKMVKKIGTDRGNQEILDQIKFYIALTEETKKYFPKIINYQIDEKPYSMEYEYIEGKTLRELVVKTPLDFGLKSALIRTINEIHESVHKIKTKKPDNDYVNRLFFQRINDRINETIKMADGNRWFLDDFYVNGKKILSPVTRIINYLEISKKKLAPDYVCTTHGQLGPSHIIYLDKMLKQFALIDVKGFKNLYDPLYDLCKLEKGLAYGTEWLESDQYFIDFEILNDTLHIHDFRITDFDRYESRKWFNYIINTTLSEYDYGTNAETRLICLVGADIISSFPFGWKTDGEKRVAALCVLLDWIAVDMEEGADKL